MSKRKLALFIGRCLPCNFKGFTKVEVSTLKLNEVINAYYSHKEVHMAVDNGLGCKSGDTVLIEQLSRRASRHGEFKKPHSPFDPPPHAVKIEPRKVQEMISTGLTSEKLVNATRFAVRRIIYKYGDMIDPLTNLSTIGRNYRYLQDLGDKVVGKDGGVRFDYDSSPARGWQEGKRDWSHREPEVKDNEDGGRKPHQW